MEYLSYTRDTLRMALARTVGALKGSSTRTDDLDDKVVTLAAAAVFSGLAYARGYDAARIAKAAHDVLGHGRLSFSPERDAALEEREFFERRRSIGQATLYNAQLLTTRLFDGFNTDRGIRINWRGHADGRVLSDGDIEVVVPFTYDDDAPVEGRANFVARFDAVTLGLVDFTALGSGNERFGFVSEVVLEEIWSHARGGLAVGYKAELEDSLSTPTRARVLSDEERAVIVGGWVSDYMIPVAGVTNLQAAEPVVVDRHEDGSLRLEASSCFDRDHDRFRSKLIIHVSTDPFYIDAVILDEEDEPVGTLDLNGKEQAYDAAGLALDLAWAENYESRREANPLDQYMARSRFDT